MNLSFSTRAAARGDVVLPTCLVLPAWLVALPPEAAAAEPVARPPEVVAVEPLPPSVECHVCLEGFHWAVASSDMIDVRKVEFNESVVDNSDNLLVTWRVIQYNAACNFICYHYAGIPFQLFSSSGIMADEMGRSLWSRVRAESQVCHWFCDQLEWPERSRRTKTNCSDTKERAGSCVSKWHMNFLRVIFLVREVIFWVPNNSKYLIFSSFCHLFGQKIEKRWRTCLKSYWGRMMRLSALCVGWGVCKTIGWQGRGFNIVSYCVVIDSHGKYCEFYRIRRRNSMGVKQGIFSPSAPEFFSALQGLNPPVRRGVNCTGDCSSARRMISVMPLANTKVSIQKVHLARS